MHLQWFARLPPGRAPWGSAGALAAMNGWAQLQHRAGVGRVWLPLGRDSALAASSVLLGISEPYGADHRVCREASSPRCWVTTLRRGSYWCVAPVPGEWASRIGDPWQPRGALMVILRCRRGGGPRAVRGRCSRLERRRCGLVRARGLVALLRRRDLAGDEAIGPSWSIVGRSNQAQAMRRARPAPHRLCRRGCRSARAALDDGHRVVMTGTAVVNSDVNLMFAALMRLAERPRSNERVGWRVGRCAGPARLASRKLVRDEISATPRWVRVPGVNGTRASEQPRSLRVGVV
jgi:hypothetical protein